MSDSFPTSVLCKAFSLRDKPLKLLYIFIASLCIHIFTLPFYLNIIVLICTVTIYCPYIWNAICSVSGFLLRLMQTWFHGNNAILVRNLAPTAPLRIKQRQIAQCGRCEGFAGTTAYM